MSEQSNQSSLSMVSELEAKGLAINVSNVRNSKTELKTTKDNTHMHQNLERDRT